MNNALCQLSLLFERYEELIVEMVRCGLIQTGALKENALPEIQRGIEKQKSLSFQLAGLDYEREKLYRRIEEAFGLAPEAGISGILPFVSGDLRSKLERFLRLAQDKLRELREINENNRMLTLHALHFTNKVLGILKPEGVEATYQGKGELHKKEEDGPLRLNKVV